MHCLIDMDPFLPPDWRWRRVSRLATQQPAPGRCSRHDDDRVRAGRDFLVRYNHRPDEASRLKLCLQNPHLAVAFEVYRRRKTNPGPAYEIEARLLGRQSSRKIAGLVSVSPETVDWYESLFYAVRDRMDRQAWVMHQVLAPEMSAEYSLCQLARYRDVSAHLHVSGFYSASRKALAYLGGEQAADALLCWGFDLAAVPTTPDGFRRWVDAGFRGTVRVGSTQSLILQTVGTAGLATFVALHVSLAKAGGVADGDEGGNAGDAVHEIAAALLASAPYATGEVAAGMGWGGVDADGYEARAGELVERSRARRKQAALPAADKEGSS